MRQVRMVVFASGWDSLGSKAEAICAGVDPNSSLDGATCNTEGASPWWYQCRLTPDYLSRRNTQSQLSYLKQLVYR